MGAWRDLMKEDDMWKVANFVASIHGTKRQDERHGLSERICLQRSAERHVAGARASAPSRLHFAQVNSR